MEKCLDNFGKFRSFKELPDNIVASISEFLLSNNCLSIDEYQFHLNNYERSFIIAGWSNVGQLDFFTMLKIDDFWIRGRMFKSLVSFLYEYFDYSPVYSLYSSQKEVKSIKNLFKADNIEVIGFLNTSMKYKDAKFYSNEDVYLYDSRKTGFESLLHKKSIKRHYNGLIKSKNVEFVHHYFNSASSCDFVDDLKSLHKERWAFEGIRSSFLGDQYRNTFYNNKSENRIISIVRNKENKEIIAIHYGFILADSLLWHTPVINIKYYNYSPLEPLLKFMFEFCLENGISIFDFGLGSEAYKDRFSNSKKQINSYYFPISLRSLFFLNLFYKNSGLIKLSLLRINTFKGRVKLLLNKRNSIVYYHLESQNIVTPKNEFFRKIDNWEDYYDIMKRIQFKISKEFYHRFKRGDVFYCLIDENRMMCSGWGGNPVNFSVLEIDKIINFACDIILYDFITPAEYRNNGFYKNLLSSIGNSTNIRYGIFAEKGNHRSNRGILSAGFVKMNIYYGWKKN